jgi:hypothetical protein
MEQLMDTTCCQQLGLLGYDAYQKKWTPNARLETYFALIDQIAAAANPPLNMGGNEGWRTANLQV